MGNSAEISADGSTVTVNLLLYEEIEFVAHTWRDGLWTQLPVDSPFIIHQGISADGSIALFRSADYGSGGRLSISDGIATTLIPSTPGLSVNGGLTRDGETVIGAEYQGPLEGPVSLWKWKSGIRTELGVLGDSFRQSSRVLVGDRDDRFVVQAQVDTEVGQRERVLLYDQGSIVEFDDILGLGSFNSRVIDMNADASVILGRESATDDPTGVDVVESTWIYRDGNIQELVADGLSDVHGFAVSDDGSVIAGSGSDATGNYDSFLMYEDGRQLMLSDLLEREGLSLSADQNASIADISADGTVISGVIYQGEWTAFGPRFTLFTLTVPTPGALGLFGAGALWGSRRRR